MLLTLTALGLLVATGGRILTGLILVIAGSAKLRAGPTRFHEVILGYDLVPEKIAWILARWLPWVEVISGGLLVFGFLSQVGAVLATALLLVFSTAIALSLLRGRHHDCGCFGQPSRVQQVQWRLVYRNLILIALLLAVYAFEGGALSLDSWLGLRVLNDSKASIGLLLLSGVWLSTFSTAVLLHVLTPRRSVRRCAYLKIHHLMDRQTQQDGL